MAHGNGGRACIAVEIAMRNSGLQGRPSRGRLGEISFSGKNGPLSSDVAAILEVVERYLSRLREALADVSRNADARTRIDGQEFTNGSVVTGLRKGGNPREYLKTFLTYWLSAERDKFAASLRTTYLEVFMRSFNDALVHWQEHFGYGQCTAAKETEPARLWAEDKARYWASQIEETIRRRALEIVEQAETEGLPYAETVKRLDELLSSEGLLNDIKGWAVRDAVWEANQAGYLESSLAVGAQHKTWLTQGDEYVCRQCNANESQGPLPLRMWFLSGHLAPPGHRMCRCSLLYKGVTPESIASGLAELGVVCLFEPK
jgi:hypothetical protein